jgi:hypothetical protein
MGMRVCVLQGAKRACNGPVIGLRVRAGARDLELSFGSVKDGTER